MLKIAILILALAIANANTEANWQVFKKKYNKSYVGDQEVMRHYIWQSNVRKIQKQNELFAQGKSSFYLAVNEYADMSSAEFNQKMNGVRLNRKLKPGNFESGMYKNLLPATVDWRTKGWVTPVKNQGNCGSCYAFSTTGALEAQHFNITGTLVSLSESNIVDCTKKWGNYGCNGGLMDNSFQYVIDNGGIDTEAGYPYSSFAGECFFTEKNVGATERDYRDILEGSEDELQKAVAQIGPVSVAIDASQDSFQLYAGGVYDQPSCSSINLDHGVLVVGYGTLNGTDYWLVKNSWGSDWGLKGYIMMTRNKGNQCGIATMASYPLI